MRSLGADASLHRMSNGKIAFLGGFGDVDGSLDVINPDGSGLRRLIRFSQGAGNPVWSPDGRRIAFFRSVGHPGGSTGELWVMSANGSHPRRVYTQSMYFSEPANGPVWSPDGTHIVFDSNRPTKDIQTFYGISVIDANGGHLHVLVSSGEEPAWRPVP